MLIVPIVAMRPVLVQMFEVARSRRMCCSRVCKVRTKPRRPSLSTVSATSRPGSRRRCSFFAAKNPSAGPPKLAGVPIDWPSAIATSAPYSPGGARTPSDTGSTLAMRSAPARCVGLGDPARVLEKAEDVRLLHDDCRHIVAEGLGEHRRRRGRRRWPAPSRSGGRRQSRRCAPPRHDRDARRPRGGRAAGAWRRRRAAPPRRAPSRRRTSRRWRRPSPVSSATRVWNSKITISVPWLTSG